MAHLKKCTYWLTVVCMALQWTLNFLFSPPAFWQQYQSPLSSLSHNLQPRIYFQRFIVSRFALYHGRIICRPLSYLICLMSVTFVMILLSLSSPPLKLHIYMAVVQVFFCTAKTTKNNKKAYSNVILSRNKFENLIILKRICQLREIISFFFPVKVSRCCFGSNDVKMMSSWTSDSFFFLFFQVDRWNYIVSLHILWLF